MREGWVSCSPHRFSVWRCFEKHFGCHLFSGWDVVPAQVALALPSWCFHWQVPLLPQMLGTATKATTKKYLCALQPFCSKTLWSVFHIFPTIWLPAMGSSSSSSQIQTYWNWGWFGRSVSVEPSHGQETWQWHWGGLTWTWQCRRCNVFKLCNLPGCIGYKVHPGVRNVVNGGQNTQELPNGVGRARCALWTPAVCWRSPLQVQLLGDPTLCGGVVGGKKAVREMVQRRPYRVTCRTFAMEPGGNLYHGNLCLEPLLGNPYSGTLGSFTRCGENFGN